MALLMAIASAGAGQTVQNPKPASPGQVVTPPRGAPRPAPAEKGTAIIRGHVLSSDDGSPVRRAEVTALLSQGGRTFATLADADGRFQLDALPAGVFTVNATKFGYMVPGGHGPLAPPALRIELADRQMTFQLSSVAPGNYLIVARDRDGFGQTATEVGSQRISVAGEDVENVTIFTGQAAIVRGRVTTDDGSPLPLQVRRGQVTAPNADPYEPQMGQWPVASLNDDGTFELKGLSGRRRIELQRAANWFIKEVRAGGDDVTDTGIEFASGQVIEDLEIVLTQKAGTMMGVVTDAAAKPVSRATVIAFADDECLWMPRSRFIRTGVTADNGRFRVSDLRAFDGYLLIALAGLEEGQYADPELLRAVKDQATRLRLPDAETKTMDLKLAKLPQ